MTSSPDRKLNPYQPPPAVVGATEFDAFTRITYALNKRERSYAEARYLLHWHPKLLLFSSLAMMFISCWIVMVATMYGLAPFLPTTICLLAISAAIYSALVYRTKKQVRIKQQEHGIATGEVLSLESDLDRITLVTAMGSYHWSNEHLKTFRTKRGLLICCEPYFFVFVPKNGSFHQEGYKLFVKTLQSRCLAQPKISA